MIKEFLKNAKKYIDYLMKLDFKDLFANFVEIIMLVILACLVYLPFGVIRDAIYQFFVTFLNLGSIFFSIYNILLNLLCGMVAFYLFMYMFNNRYADLDEIRKNSTKQSIKSSSNKISTKNNVDEFELPKKKN